MGRPMKGTNLAELLEPILAENAERFGLVGGEIWSADEVAREELLRVLPPEISSEVRLGDATSVLVAGGLVVVATKSVVEVAPAELAEDAAAVRAGPRGEVLVDAIEWLVVRLDAPLVDDPDSFAPVAGQTGRVLAVFGWAPATADAADNWIGELLFDLGLPVFDEGDFELREGRER